MGGDMEFLAWLRKGSSGSASGVLGAFEVIYSPAAARAREELDRQHEQVIPTPSPGDRLLSEGRLVIPEPVAAPDQPPPP